MILALLLIHIETEHEGTQRACNIIVKCNKDTFMGISGRRFTCVC